MMQPGLEFHLRAQVAEFNRDIAGTSAIVQRETRVMNAAVQSIDRNMVAAGRSMSGNFTAQLQNASFQIGDFAVQVASGTSAVRAFAQQAPQLLGGFGMWGAVLGAGVAVAAALGQALLSTGNEAEKFNDKAGDIRVTVDDLERAARAYASAIDATATQQTAASASIVAATQREFEAKKSLLELEMRRLEAEQAARSAALGQAFGRASDPELNRIASGQARIDAEGRRRRRPNPEAVTEAQGELGRARDEVQRLTAEAELAEIALERVRVAVNSSFRELAEASGSGGGGGRAAAIRAETGAFAEAVEQQRQVQLANIESLKQTTMDAQAIRERQAALEGNRVARELMNAAEKEGIRLSAEQRDQVYEIALAHEQLTLALAEQKAAQESTRRATEEQARAVESLESGLIGAISRARSFKDAMEQVARTLIESGLNGLLTGRGAFGGFFNDVLGTTAGGLGGLARDALGFGGFGAGPVLNAKGNAFSGGRVIPFATGGVIGSPTTFPMAGGNLGLMGEAGPEAIMPLRRGPGGRLGVEMAGGGAVRIFLADGLRAEILGDARSQAIEVVQSSQQGPGFAARVAAASRDASKARLG